MRSKNNFWVPHLDSDLGHMHHHKLFHIYIIFYFFHINRAVCTVFIIPITILTFTGRKGLETCWI